MLSLADQVELMRVFHDGTIVKLEKSTTKDLIITIECDYIVKLISHGQSSVYGVLEDCTDIYFKHWDMEETISELERITAYDLEIHDAKITNEYLNIVCLITSYDHSTTGGNLYLKLNDIKLYDELNKSISLDQLKQAASRYWAV